MLFSNFEFPVSETRRRGRWRSSRWRVSRKGHPLTKTGMRWYHHTSSAHFNRGNPPSIPMIWRSSKSLSTGVLLKSKL